MFWTIFLIALLIVPAFWLASVVFNIVLWIVIMTFYGIGAGIAAIVKLFKEDKNE